MPAGQIMRVISRDLTPCDFRVGVYLIKSIYINDPQTIPELQKYPEGMYERVVVNFNDRNRIIKLRRDISQALLLITRSEIPLRIRLK